MNDFDDIFATTTVTTKERPFDKDAWAKKKQAERQAVYDLADRTAEEISTDSDKFKAYLDVQAKFDRYSPTNALLIYAQMPTATRIKDFDGWKDNNVSIKKQQKGINILEPGEEYIREDGSVGISYNVKKVFDISQTTSKEKLQPRVSVDERLLLKALISNPPVPIQPTDKLAEGVNAFYDHGRQTIFVRKGLSAQDIFRYVSKELAHAELASTCTEEYTRSNESFKAYCTSYMLCKKNGIDVSGYSFKELPDNIRQADAQSLRAALTEIRDSTASITGRMVKVLEQARSPKQKIQER